MQQVCCVKRSEIKILLLVVVGDSYLCNNLKKELSVAGGE